MWCSVLIPIFYRGVVVVATPFATGFDHLKIADEALFKFDRCVRAMRAPDVSPSQALFYLIPTPL